MDDVLADINVEDPTAQVGSDTEMADVAPRAIQKQEKQKDDNTEKKAKKDKKSSKKEEGKAEGGEKKRKKRKNSEVEGDTESKREKRIKA